MPLDGKVSDFVTTTPDEDAAIRECAARIIELRGWKRGGTCMKDGDRVCLLRAIAIAAFGTRDDEPIPYNDLDDWAGKLGFDGHKEAYWWNDFAASSAAAVAARLRGKPYE